MNTYTKMRAYFNHDPATKYDMLRQTMLPKIDELQRTLLQIQEAIPSHLSDFVNIVHNNAMRTHDTINTFPEWIKYPSWDGVIRNSELQDLRHELIAPVKAMYAATQILQEKCLSQLSQEGAANLQKTAELATDLLEILEALTSSRVPKHLIQQTE